MQECCVVDHSRDDDRFRFGTRTEELYRHYRMWCREHDIEAVEENVFGSRMVEHGIQKKRWRIGKSATERPNFYTPIMLKHVLEQQDRERGQDIAKTIEKAAEEQQQQEEQQQEEKTRDARNEVIECPYCALENVAGNSPLFTSKKLRDVQLHIIFKHPGQDFSAADIIVLE